MSQADVTASDGTPYVAIFPTFEAIFSAYAPRPAPPSRPSSRAASQPPRDILRRTLESTISWIRTEVRGGWEETGGAGKSKGVGGLERGEERDDEGISFGALSWLPDAGEDEVLSVSVWDVKSESSAL